MLDDRNYMLDKMMVSKEQKLKYIEMRINKLLNEKRVIRVKKIKNPYTISELCILLGTKYNVLYKILKHHNMKLALSINYKLCALFCETEFYKQDDQKQYIHKENKGN